MPAVFSNEELSAATDDILFASNAASNEEQLKIEIEHILRTLCEIHSIAWNPYTYEYAVEQSTRHLDVIHGAVIIEYESPRSFNRHENAQYHHACSQAEEYVIGLSKEEGRTLEQYTLVVWDGLSIAFGYYNNSFFEWDPLLDFTKNSLHNLMLLLENGGLPLVSPEILNQFVGPKTSIGQKALPELYHAIIEADNKQHTTRTKLIFHEWARLFGQVDGNNTDKLVEYLLSISKLHRENYAENPQAYMFALNTYIAIVAKICSIYFTWSTFQ